MALFPLRNRSEGGLLIKQIRGNIAGLRETTCGELLWERVKALQAMTEGPFELDVTAGNVLQRTTAS